MKSAERIIAECRALAHFSEEPGMTKRTFLSPPMHDVHVRLTACMKSLGMIVSVDAAGNLRGRYGGAGDALYIGSHLDTVPNAGAFDGVLGVVMAIALVECLEGRSLKFPIEVVGFSEEEGVRFGIPFIGSRALVGSLDNDVLGHISDAIREFGLDPAGIPAAQAPAESIGYFEFHIEQGPMLESLGLPVAVVQSIVGQSRLEFVFTGQANHAGTTPMHLRRDAMAAAAEWIVGVESMAQSVPGLVATVGRMEAVPGAVNVIVGTVRVSLDVRHAGDATRKQAVSESIQLAERIASRRGLGLSTHTLLDQPAVAMDHRLIELLARAAGAGVHRMPSGAGHDAMIMAQRMPVAMLFLRSPGGISHHPDEAVLADDVAEALRVGLRFLEELEACQ